MSTSQQGYQTVSRGRNQAYRANLQRIIDEGVELPRIKKIYRDRAKEAAARLLRAAKKKKDVKALRFYAALQRRNELLAEQVGNPVPLSEEELTNQAKSDAVCVILTMLNANPNLMQQASLGSFAF